MIKGIKFQFGDEEYIIPPLNLASLEELQDDLAALSSETLDKRSVSTVITATWKALQRNYPEITREKVATMIDLENFKAVVTAVMDVSGLQRKAIEGMEEKQKVGESTGDTSMPT